MLRRRYFAVASKGWYGYGLCRSGCATWHVTTVRSSRLLYIHGASGSRNKLGTPWCNACRILLRHETRDESSDRNSVSCHSLATLRNAVTLQVCTHLKQTCAELEIQSVAPSWDWFRPEQRQSFDSRLYCRIFSSAGNTCLSVLALVP
jgi:hypothetical protein